MNDSSDPSDARPGAGLSVQQLLSAVENELIPRLLVAHRDDVSSADSPARRARPQSGDWAGPEPIDRFATLCAQGSEADLQEHVSGLVGQGVGLDAIYLHLVAPAARLLGLRWETDEASFVDVQLGLSRLHSLVCDCVPIGFNHPADAPLSVLLTSAPGDQHTFAIAMVADFFRRFGWQASNLCGLSPQFLIERIGSHHYDAIGFSINTRAAAGALESLIPELRKRSCNPRLIIMIGGEFLADKPDITDALDHDLIAADAHSGVLEAERLVARARVKPGAPARSDSLAMAD